MATVKALLHIYEELKNCGDFANGKLISFFSLSFSSQKCSPVVISYIFNEKLVAVKNDSQLLTENENLNDKQIRPEKVTNCLKSLAANKMKKKKTACSRPV